MKLTREQWDAMTPDEQWAYVNRAPFQIGEMVNVHPFLYGTRTIEVTSFRGRVTDAYFEDRMGWWMYSVSDEHPDPEKRKWTSNLPEMGVSAVANE